MFHQLRSKKVQLLFGSDYFRIFTNPEALATPSTPLLTTMTRYSYLAPAGTAFLIMKVNRPDFFVIVVAFIIVALFVDLNSFLFLSEIWFYMLCLCKIT